MVSGVERARIPVTVLTGFLGSGKTALLNRMLRSPRFADTAVIVNELGLYDGWTFRGCPVATIVRGETVMQDGRMVGRGGWGRYLHRRVRPA